MEPESKPPVRTTVENWEGISAFLRDLAQNVAVVPEFSSEIVRSCLVVAGFLEDRSRKVRSELPQEFEDQPVVVSPDETLKEKPDAKRVATRRRA